MAFLPGSGGRLLFWPLHLHLPHAGLPLLQEGRDWLQGELSAPPSGGDEKCRRGNVDPFYFTYF